jgi:hypothetical protein
MSSFDGEIAGKANKTVNVKSAMTDKSTSLSNSVTSTPPLQAVRTPSEKLEEQMVLSSKALSQRGGAVAGSEIVSNDGVANYGIP